VSSDQVRDSAYRTLLGGRGAAKRDYPGMLAYFESRMIREASQGQFGFLPVYLHLYHSEAIHAYGLPERLVSGQGSYSSFQPNLQNLFIQVLSADLGSKEAMFRQLQIFERLLEELCALTAKRVSRGAHPDFYHLPNYVVPALHAAQCTLNTFRNAAQNPLELAHYAEVSESLNQKMLSPLPYFSLRCWIFMLRFLSIGLI
jgi:hypothetical protein